MKKILFVTGDLHSSGVTTSMINYIDELSKNKDLKIDLLLDKNKGDYVNNISKDIRRFSSVSGSSSRIALRKAYL